MTTDLRAILPADARLSAAWRPACVCLSILAASCGGGSGGGAAPPPPPPPPPPTGADVAVSVSGETVAMPGESLTFTVTAANSGPEDAGNVVVSLQIPPALNVTAISNGGTRDGGVIVWPAIDSLADSASQDFTASADAPLIGPLIATGSATADSADPSAANHDGSAAASIARTLITFSTIGSVSGEAAGDQFGWIVVALPDIDGDAVLDVLVTAPTNDAGGGDAGRAYVYSGTSLANLHTLTGTRVGGQFGIGADAAGDVDGDGIGDVIVGAPFAQAGRATVFSGADASVLLSVQGQQAGDNFGFSVAGAGDVNGDGVDDVLVGATGNDASANNAGRGYVYSGADGTQIHVVTGTFANGQLGSAAGGFGDLDGDGFGDFGFGALNAGPAARGLVYVFSGQTGQPLFPAIMADASGATLGQFWLSTPGDVNGDSVPDIYAADINNGATGADTGRAYVYSGADGSIVHTLTGETPGDQFGIARAANSDVDGDGVLDIFVAAWLSSEGANGAGKAYLYSGADGSLLRTFTGTVANRNLGFDAVAIGDVDFDGAIDFLLSGGISASTPGTLFVVAGVPLPAP